MLDKAKDFLRRRLRGMQRGSQYPLLLPHHTLTEDGLTNVEGKSVRIDPALKMALGLCDGKRPLSQIAQDANLARAEIIKAQDDGLILIWREPVPETSVEAQHHPHSIIISPHLDDAALSCGGKMLGDQAILVVNIFSQTGWWRFGHGETDRPRIQACRLVEEELVSRLSGASIKMLGLPEALLRGWEMGALFGHCSQAGGPNEDISQKDADAVAAIKDSIGRLANEHPLAHWFLPLGIGNHIDHRLARDATLESLRSGGIKHTHLHFYEDLPYAAKLGPTADFSRSVPGFVLREESLEIDDLIGWKLELLRAYWSQFRWAELVELKSYAKAAGGREGPVEISWTPVN